jgi:hypothetical protein
MAESNKMSKPTTKGEQTENPETKETTGLINRSFHDMRQTTRSCEQGPEILKEIEPQKEPLQEMEPQQAPSLELESQQDPL